MNNFETAPASKINNLIYFSFVVVIFFALWSAIGVKSAHAESVSTNTFTEYSVQSYSYPNSTISGVSNQIPPNAVVVELGYGSDDHDYFMGAAMGEFYLKSPGNWGVRPAGAKVALSGVERRGVMVQLNSDYQWNAPADTYLSRWGWASSDTSGGHFDNNYSPNNVCVHVGYKLFDPVTHVIDNSQTYEAGNCTNNGYQVPSWLRGFVRAEEGKFFTNIGQFQFGNDAKMRGAVGYVRRISSQVLDAQYVSDTIPRDAFESSSVHSGSITMRNHGNVTWTGDNSQRTSGNCDNFPIVEGPNPTQAGETCTETYNVTSSTYKLRRIDTDFRVTAPTELDYQFQTSRTLQANLEEIVVCEEGGTGGGDGGGILILSQSSLWQRIIDWLIPKALAVPIEPPGGGGFICHSEGFQMVATVISGGNFNVEPEMEVAFPITFTTQADSSPASLMYKMVKKAGSNPGPEDIMFGDLATIPVTTVNAPPQTISITSNTVRGTFIEDTQNFSLLCSPSLIPVTLNTSGVPTAPVQFNVLARSETGLNDTVNLSFDPAAPLVPEFIGGSTVNPVHSPTDNPPNNRNVRVTGTWSSGVFPIKVNGVAQGNSSLRDDCTAYLDVHLAGRSLDRIEITPFNRTIFIAGTQSYTVTAYYSDNSSQVVTNLSSCYSRNPSIASIPTNPCTARGLSVGTALIYADYTETGVTKTSNDAILNVRDIIVVDDNPNAPTVWITNPCGEVNVNWTPGATPPPITNYKVYRSSSSSGPWTESSAISPLLGSSVRSFTDPSPSTSGYWYMVRAFNNNTPSPDSNLVLGTLEPCIPNLTSSDKDLYKVDNNTNSSTALRCNSISDPFGLPSSGIFKTGSKVYFNINICNTGFGPITGVTVTEIDAHNLDQVKLDGTVGCNSSGAGTSGPYNVSDVAPNAPCTLKISAKLKAPVGATSFLYRFWNTAEIRTNEDSIMTPPGPKRVTTPPYLFSDTGKPVRNETAQ